MMIASGVHGLSHAVDEAMKLLNVAFCARKVYWPEHPAAVTPLTAAARLLAQQLAAIESIVVIAFQDRVVSADQELESGPELLSGFFGVLRNRGTQSITFRRGLTVKELSELLAQLSVRDAAGPVKSSACVHLGCIGSNTVVVPAVSEHADSDVKLQVPRLKEAWVGLIHKGLIDRNMLDAAAANITSTLRNSVDDSICLAPVQSHDAYTFVHSTNVAVLSAALGEAIGLTAPLVVELTIAALVHDVGKLRVSREVLNKNGSLTPGEFSAVARHPGDGAGILFAARELPAIAAVVAYEHHMHPDGSGYPRIKIGHQMQLASQIVQIADVFDALRTNRPYRAGVSCEEARAIMYKDIRRFYDPDLLDTFFASVATRVESSIAGPEPMAAPAPDATRLILPSQCLVA